MKRFASTGLSVLLLITQIFFAHAQEISLWDQRRKAIQDTHLLTTSPLRHLNPLSSSKIEVSKPSDLISLLSADGYVRDVKPGKGASTIVYIQDVHGQPEAQKNIAAMILKMLSVRPGTLIGLEGTEGRFPMEEFRSPSQAINTKVGGYFLNEGLITGAEYAGFAAATDPQLYGLEDKALYLKNVDAVRAALSEQKPALARLEKEKTALQLEKQKVYSPMLLGLDQKRRDYLDEKLSVGEYLRELIAVSSKLETKNFPQISLFLSAFQLEKSLNFSRAEHERGIFLSRLTARLSSAALKDLVQKSADMRAGTITYAVYYRLLKSAAGNAGVSLSATSEFDRYVAYVLQTDAIDTAAFLAEIPKFEETIWSRLCRTPEQKRLHVESVKLGLKEKLTRLTLAPTEWARYRRGAVSLPQNGETRSFEMFYDAAEARNATLARNLGLLGGGGGTPPLRVIVAGGFHSDGLTRLLANGDATFIAVSPKLSKVDPKKENDYLNVFAQKDTPLGKLFEAPKISLIMTESTHPIPGLNEDNAAKVRLARSLEELAVKAEQTGRAETSEAQGYRLMVDGPRISITKLNVLIPSWILTTRIASGPVSLVKSAIIKGAKSLDLSVNSRSRVLEIGFNGKSELSPALKKKGTAVAVVKWGNDRWREEAEAQVENQGPAGAMGVWKLFGLTDLFWIGFLESTLLNTALRHAVLSHLPQAPPLDVLMSVAPVLLLTWVALSALLLLAHFVAVMRKDGTISFLDAEAAVEATLIAQRSFVAVPFMLIDLLLFGGTPVFTYLGLAAGGLWHGHRNDPSFLNGSNDIPPLSARQLENIKQAMIPRMVTINEWGMGDTGYIASPDSVKQMLVMGSESLRVAESVADMWLQAPDDRKPMLIIAGGIGSGTITLEDHQQNHDLSSPRLADRVFELINQELDELRALRAKSETDFWNHLETKYRIANGRDRVKLAATPKKEDRRRQGIKLWQDFLPFTQEELARQAVESLLFDRLLDPTTRYKTKIPEAFTYRAVMLAKGVSDAAILAEAQSTSTRENTRFITDFLREHHDRVLGFVQKPYICRRARIAALHELTTEGVFAPELKTILPYRFTENDFRSMPQNKLFDNALFLAREVELMLSLPIGTEEERYVPSSVRTAFEELAGVLGRLPHYGSPNVTRAHNNRVKETRPWWTNEKNGVSIPAILSAPQRERWFSVPAIFSAALIFFGGMLLSVRPPYLFIGGFFAIWIFVGLIMSVVNYSYRMWHAGVYSPQGWKHASAAIANYGIISAFAVAFTAAALLWVPSYFGWTSTLQQTYSMLAFALSLFAGYSTYQALHRYRSWRAVLSPKVVPLSGGFEEEPSLHDKVIDFMERLDQVKQEFPEQAQLLVRQTITTCLPIFLRAAENGQDPLTDHNITQMLGLAAFRLARTYSQPNVYRMIRRLRSSIKIYASKRVSAHNIVKTVFLPEHEWSNRVNWALDDIPLLIQDKPGAVQILLLAIVNPLFNSLKMKPEQAKEKLSEDLPRVFEQQIRAFQLADFSGWGSAEFFSQLADILNPVLRPGILTVDQMREIFERVKSEQTRRFAYRRASVRFTDGPNGGILFSGLIGTGLLGGAVHGLLKAFSEPAVSPAPAVAGRVLSGSALILFAAFSVFGLMVWGLRMVQSREGAPSPDERKWSEAFRKAYDETFTLIGGLPDQLHGAIADLVRPMILLDVEGDLERSRIQVLTYIQLELFTRVPVAIANHAPARMAEVMTGLNKIWAGFFDVPFDSPRAEWLRDLDMAFYNLDHYKADAPGIVQGYIEATRKQITLVKGIKDVAESRHKLSADVEKIFIVALYQLAKSDFDWVPTFGYRFRNILSVVLPPEFPSDGQLIARSKKLSAQRSLRQAHRESLASSDEPRIWGEWFFLGAIGSLFVAGAAYGLADHGTMILATMSLLGSMIGTNSNLAPIHKNLLGRKIDFDGQRHNAAGDQRSDSDPHRAPTPYWLNPKKHRAFLTPA